MQTFTLNDFFWTLGTILFLYSLFVFLHKRGLKKEERKREADKKIIDTKLDMDFDSAYWPDRSL